MPGPSVAVADSASAFGDPDAHRIQGSPLVVRPVLREFANYPNAPEVLAEVIQLLSDVPLNEANSALDPSDLIENNSLPPWSPRLCRSYTDAGRV